jgi:hypothetical protein
MPVISTVSEGEIGRITVQGQLGQKLSKTPMIVSQAWWHVPVIPAVGETIGRSEVSPGQRVRPYLKNN